MSSLHRGFEWSPALAAQRLRSGAFRSTVSPRLGEEQAKRSGQPASADSRGARLLSAARDYESALALALCALLAWLAQFHHFRDLGLYEDDYFFISEAMKCASSSALAAPVILTNRPVSPSAAAAP